MKKIKPGIRLLGLIFPVLIQISSFAQGGIKAEQGARIVSETGSYWVVDHGSFTITSPNASYPVTFDNLKITSSASLIIPPLNYLTVTGTLTNDAGNSGLIMNSDATGTGSLINSTTGVNGTVQRYIAHRADNLHGWHFLSSPVASQAIQPGFVPNPPDNNQAFFSWSEPLGLWINSKTVSNTWASGFESTFTQGKGYLVNYNADVTKQFTDVLNCSDITKPGLTLSGSAYSGWHLLGNPFTSAIIWHTGWNAFNIATIAKIWNESGSSYTDVAAGEIIPATQGFMVQVTQATGGVLTIPALARMHGSNTWYKSTNAPMIHLKANDLAGHTYQESVITFNTQATEGYDADFDAHFLAGYAPQFYSVAGEEQLSTNVLPGLDNQTTIPFNFIKTDGANYTIVVEKIENVPGQVFLTDLKTNQTQNLNENPLYSFTSSTGDNPARFLISFSHVGIETQTGENSRIFVYDNTLYISNPGESNLEIYNMIGQKMLSEKTHNEPLYQLKLQVATGYYVVRGVNGLKVMTQKVFVK